jgi:hypothetical protein
MDQIVQRRRTIPRSLNQSTSLKPPNWMSWSSKDGEATHASSGRHRRRQPRLMRPPEQTVSPVATTATVEAYRASRNRRHHWAWSVLPSLIRFGSIVAASLPASGASSLLDPGGAPPSVARLRAAPPLALEISVTRTPEGTAAKT